jgi:hypothetical protein
VVLRVLPTPISVGGARGETERERRLYTTESYAKRDDGEECGFPGVVVNTVAAMLTFQLPSGVVMLQQQVEEWREGSRTRLNGELRLGGWLLSPMLLDSRQMMMMVRVFHQLDIAVEETWIRNAMEQRRAELNTLSLQQWAGREAIDNYMPAARENWQENTRTSGDEGMAKMRIETAGDECIEDGRVLLSTCSKPDPAV